MVFGLAQASSWSMMSVLSRKRTVVFFAAGGFWVCLPAAGCIDAVCAPRAPSFCFGKRTQNHCSWAPKPQSNVGRWRGKLVRYAHSNMPLKARPTFLFESPNRGGWDIEVCYLFKNVDMQCFVGPEKRSGSGRCSCRQSLRSCRPTQ